MIDISFLLLDPKISIASVPEICLMCAAHRNSIQRFRLIVNTVYWIIDKMEETLESSASIGVKKE